MAIPEDVVAAVVSDVSERMGDPNYAQLAVGNFVQVQPDVSRYLTAHSEELGGEGVIHAVFHAEVIAQCFERHIGRRLSRVGFPELDAASGGDPVERLTQVQPAVADYLKSNVEEDAMRRALGLIALAFDEVS